MKQEKKKPLHPALDLFGEVPVLKSDVEAWVMAVVGLSPESWRWEWYVRAWNVIDKIRHAKLAGNFDQIIGR